MLMRRRRSILIRLAARRLGFVCAARLLVFAVSAMPAVAAMAAMAMKQVHERASGQEDEGQPAIQVGTVLAHQEEQGNGRKTKKYPDGDATVLAPGGGRGGFHVNVLLRWVSEDMALGARSRLCVSMACCRALGVVAATAAALARHGALSTSARYVGSKICWRRCGALIRQRRPCFVTGCRQCSDHCHHACGSSLLSGDVRKPTRQVDFNCANFGDFLQSTRHRCDARATAHSVDFELDSLHMPVL